MNTYGIHRDLFSKRGLTKNLDTGGEVAIMSLNFFLCTITNHFTLLSD